MIEYGMLNTKHQQFYEELCERFKYHSLKKYRDDRDDRDDRDRLHSAESNTTICSPRSRSRSKHSHKRRCRSMFKDRKKSRRRRKSRARSSRSRQRRNQYISDDSVSKKDIAHSLQSEQTEKSLTTPSSGCVAVV